MFDALIPAILLFLFKWYNWFKKKYPSYEEQEQEQEDYGYIE